MTRLATAAALALLASSALAADPAGPVVRPAGEQAFSASGSLPPGAEYHLIWEDPRTRAVQALVRVPSGYEIPAHRHSHDETILVLKGRIELDFGAGNRRVLRAGDYALIPGDTAFALRASGWGGAHFLVAFSGPFDSKPAELKK